MIYSEIIGTSILVAVSAMLLIIRKRRNTNEFIIELLEWLAVVLIAVVVITTILTNLIPNIPWLGIILIFGAVSWIFISVFYILKDKPSVQIIYKIDNIKDAKKFFVLTTIMQIVFGLLMFIGVIPIL